MTQETGACAEPKGTNGITIKADKDYGAIELALVVNDKKIGCFLKIEEANELAEALKGAICKMMGDDTCGGRCSDEELAKISENYREDDEKATDQNEGTDQSQAS